MIQHIPQGGHVSKNKSLTKYLTESRKIWSDGNQKSQKGLSKKMVVLDVYDKDGKHVHSIIFNKKTKQCVDTISNNILSAMHQIDIIRLQNELDELERKTNIFTKRNTKRIVMSLLTFL